MNFTMDDFKNRDFLKMRHTFLLSMCAGVSFGLYMLQWTSGIFFGGIVTIYVILQMIYDHKKDIAGILTVSSVTFFSAFPFVILFFNPSNGFSTYPYSYVHIVITLGASIFFIGLALLSMKLNTTKLPGFYYPISIIAVITGAIVVAKLFIPGLYGNFQSFFTIFRMRTGGAITIAEASAPTRDMIFYNFPGMIYYIAILTILSLFVVLFLYKWSPERALFFVWCGVMFIMTTGQNRWFYYYSVNVAILSALFMIYMTRFTGIYNLIKDMKEEVTDFGKLQKYTSENQIKVLGPPVVCIVFILLICMPSFTASSEAAPHGIVGSDYYQWHE
ncbi:hypothetical protein KA005_49985, partial [bacterium]|nr:hypothetical protein [bacterium]